VKRKTIGLYIDLIEYYCQKTVSSIDRHAPFYAANILKHMNADDKELVPKVVSSMNAIFGRL